MTVYKVVVDKSTVPVGTAAQVKAAIAEELKSRGVDVPYSVVSNTEFLKEGAAVEKYVGITMEALEGGDALVIVTEWKEFRSADLDAMKQKIKAPLIFDGRNLYDLKLVRAQGIEYFAIGR